MKIEFNAKTVYPVFILILVAALAFVMIQNNSKKDGDKAKTENNMPDDDTHRKLGHGGKMPSKDNVSQHFKVMLDSLKQIVESHPNDTLAMRQYADNLAMAHSNAEALKYYDIILGVNPNRTDIINNKVLIYFNTKEYDKCEHLLNQLLTMNVNDHQALYNLGALAATKKDKAKAKLIWSQVLQKFPGTQSAKLAEANIPRLDKEL